MCPHVKAAIFPPTAADAAGLAVCRLTLVHSSLPHIQYALKGWCCRNLLGLLAALHCVLCMAAVPQLASSPVNVLVESVPGMHDHLDAALLFLIEDLVRMRRLCQRQIMSDDLCGNRGILRLHSEAGSNFI